MFTRTPFIAGIGVAASIIFLLGVFLGRISGHGWFRSGLQTLVIGLITLGLIYVLTGSS